MVEIIIKEIDKIIMDSKIAIIDLEIIIIIKIEEIIMVITLIETEDLWMKKE